MPRTLTEEELGEHVELVGRLILTFPEPRRQKVKDLLDGPVGDQYFLAPASSKIEFHDCFAGGLMVHSLAVVKNLKILADALCPKKFSSPTLAFAGLFHDLGKVGDGEHPCYIPEQSQWHREKMGRLYTINPECLAMPNSERGLYILQKAGIELSSEEYLAIRLNDGMYDATNKSYAMHEPDLALLVHFADRWACQQEKAAG